MIGPMFDRADQVILIIFASEIVLKTIGFDDKPWHYFRDAWNCFDFVVVVGTLVPFGGKAVAVLRLLRVLRIAKLFKSLTQLQIIMSGLFHGMKSIAYIGLLVLLLFYVFGVCAIMFFRPNDPIHFGSLHITMVTLFRCATVRRFSSRAARFHSLSCVPLSLLSPRCTALFLLNLLFHCRSSRTGAISCTLRCMDAIDTHTASSTSVARTVKRGDCRRHCSSSSSSSFQPLSF